MTRTTIILYCFIAAQPVFATTSGSESEVAAAFAIIELCNEKHPEYQKQNTAAFTDWRSRNRASVKKMLNRKEFRKEIEIVKENLINLRTPEHIKHIEVGCKHLSVRLSKPEFDIPDQSIPENNAH